MIRLWRVAVWLECLLLGGVLGGLASRARLAAIDPPPVGWDALNLFLGWLMAGGLIGAALGLFCALRLPADRVRRWAGALLLALTAAIILVAIFR